MDIAIIFYPVGLGLFRTLLYLVKFNQTQGVMDIMDILIAG